MYENNTKMSVTGSVEDDKPLVLFETDDLDSTALRVNGVARIVSADINTVTADLISTAEFQCDGDVFLSGNLRANNLDVAEVEATTHVYSPYLRVMGQGIGDSMKLIQAVRVTPGGSASVFSVHADGSCNIGGVANTFGLTTHNIEISMSDELPLDTAGLQLVSTDQQLCFIFGRS